MLQPITKDPNAELSYGLDWDNYGTNDGSANDRGWLQGDTISTSTWFVSGADGQLTTASGTNTATATTVKLIGGTVNRDYTLTNRITTTQGLIDDRSVIVKVRQR
jgi:hypothetical protein